ncbi:serine hydrolase [Streptomyces smyrnaeus]|uniref:serine hydrolase n=1 Tax=Streptomyces smyrnaeus TaxID=1387713 RepID=UPI0036806E0F
MTAARLAGQRPFWEPGAAYGYHGFVIGALTGEVVRRVTGRSIQEIYEERIRAARPRLPSGAARDARSAPRRRTADVAPVGRRRRTARRWARGRRTLDRGTRGAACRSRTQGRRPGGPAAEFNSWSTRSASWSTRP